MAIQQPGPLFMKLPQLNHCLIKNKIEQIFHVFSLDNYLVLSKQYSNFDLLPIIFPIHHPISIPIIRSSYFQPNSLYFLTLNLLFGTFLSPQVIIYLYPSSRKQVKGKSTSLSTLTIRLIHLKLILIGRSIHLFLLRKAF